MRLCGQNEASKGIWRAWSKLKPRENRLPNWRPSCYSSFMWCTLMTRWIWRTLWVSFPSSLSTPRVRAVLRPNYRQISTSVKPWFFGYIHSNVYKAASISPHTSLRCYWRLNCMSYGSTTICPNASRSRNYLSSAWVQLTITDICVMTYYRWLSNEIQWWSLWSSCTDLIEEIRALSNYIWRSHLEAAIIGMTNLSRS